MLTLRRTPMIVWALTALVSACGGGGGEPAADAAPDTAVDAGGRDTGAPCAADGDCDDGIHCNGAERCDPTSASADARGCAPAGTAPCRADETCDEVGDACVPVCDEPLDQDGDGALNPACGGDDCDDRDPNRFPGNLEVCDGAAHDEDCNDTTFGFVDADADGAGSDQCCNVAEDGSFHCGGDCNDADSSVRPGAGDGPPMTCDGLDNDCDGTADVGCPCIEGETVACGTEAQLASIGTCLPGAQICSGGMLTAECIGGRAPSVEVCDDLDNDCDGEVDDGVLRTYYADADGDGYGVPGSTTLACSPPAGWASNPDDCDDTAAGVSPSATEVCNGRDDNCNGATDEGLLQTFYADTDGDGFGDPATTTQACFRPDGFSALNTDCDDTRSGISPAAPEVCDRRDNNCIDGIDEGCACASGDTRACGTDDGAGGLLETGACRSGEQLCLSGLWGACTGSVAPTSEVCNGVDDDCDGTTDETTTASCYLDADGDGAGAGALLDVCAAPGGGCPAGYAAVAGDCNGGSALIRPGAAEVCNGVDDDCSGVADDGVSMVCALGSSRGGTGAFGTCGSVGGVYVCASDCRSEFFVASPPAESCNGLDDDCDGEVDDPWECVQGSTGNECVTACGTLGSYVCSATCTRGACAATEVCNGCDDDGDGSTDEGLLVTCWPDADDDGYAPPGSGSSDFCPVPGRAAEGGCPIHWTQRAPGGVADCADDDPRRFPGAVELCNGLDDDCAGGVDDGASAACSLPGAVTGCFAGSCGPWQCDPGFADCDSVASNGCEVDLWNDPVGCGACGHTCGVAGTCTEGLCDVPVAIGGGSAHMCVLRSAGGIACWGANSDGQLGDRTTSGREAPVAVEGMVATEMYVGRAFGCGLAESGEVLCWGDNDRYTLGRGFRGARELVPAPVLGITDAVAVGGGHFHACAIRATGEALCWGANNRGQVGDGTSLVDVESPATVLGLGDARTITGGNNHTCALRASGAVACWGTARSNGLATDTVTPTDVAGVSGAVQVEAAGNMSCARLGTGEVLCWGSESGQGLGDGTTQSATPVTVTAPATAIDIDVGEQHSCIVHSGGNVQCWGAGTSGQLGTGDFTSSPLPVDVVGVDDAVEVAVSGNNTCVRRAGGQVLCWGFGGRIGDGTNMGSALPVSVVGDLDAGRQPMEVHGGWEHSCTRRSSGEVLCWGDNADGQLGDGTTTSRTTPAPVLVDAGGDHLVATHLSVGEFHSCARLVGGEVRCWGAAGRLGDGLLTDQPYPVPVTGLTDAVDLNGSETGTCALRATGEVTCWGRNPVAPVDASGAALSGVVRVATSGRFSCASLSTGELACWGTNDAGQLGDGTTTDRAFAAPVVGLTHPTDFALGRSHICAAPRGGSFSCWGSNARGQLGVGTTVYASRPAPVSGGTAFEHPALGEQHTCAIDPSGAVWCWGRDDEGQVGPLSGPQVDEPRSLDASPTAATLGAGRLHGCLVGTDEEVYCWGSNSRGQLGVVGGSTTVPTRVDGI